MHLAFDLGAESGRAVAGELDDGPDLDTRLAVLGILGMSNAVANWYRTEDVAVERISAEFARLLVDGVVKPARRR